MNWRVEGTLREFVSAGCHINDVMNPQNSTSVVPTVSAGCHINDVMNSQSVS